MTTTPILEMTDWAAAQASPWIPHNLALRTLEQGAMWFRFIDRDLDTAPGSPAEGDCYLIDGTGAGGWSGHTDEIAYYSNGGWLFITPLEGMGAGVLDENVAVAFLGGSWVTLATAASSIPSVTTQSGTTYTLDADDANTVILFTNASGCDVTVPDGVFSVGDFIELHQQTTGTVAVLDNGTSTVNARDGTIFLAGQWSVAALRCTASNVFNLTGDLEDVS